MDFVHYYLAWHFVRDVLLLPGSVEEDVMNALNVVETRSLSTQLSDMSIYDQLIETT